MHLRIGLVVFLTLAAGARAAAAQDGTDDSTTGEAKDAGDAGNDEQSAKADDKAAKAEEPLEISGRVFARSESSSVDSAPWLHELKLDSARIGASYRWKNKVRVKAAVELAGGPDVKDAYVDVDGPNGLDVRAGYFKVPISVIENASAWDLPTVDRGALAEVVEDGLGLSGRRDGVMVDWESDAGDALLGVMLSQSAAVDGQDPARPLADGGGVMATLRGELQVCACARLGAHVSNRETTINQANINRYWAGGVDLQYDLDPAAGGLRLWVDVIGGQGHYYALSRGEAQTTFVSAQGIAAWRAGGRKKHTQYVEAFAGGGYFNPSIALKGDDVMNAMAGVNGGLWKRWRVQGQLEVVSARGLRPNHLAGLDRNVNDQIKGVIQLGSAF